MGTFDEQTRRRHQRKRAARRRRKQIQTWISAAVAVLVLLTLAAVWFIWCRPEAAPDPASPSAPAPSTSQTEVTGLAHNAATDPPPTQPQPVVEVGRATITATGDIMTHLPVIRAGQQGDSYDFNSFFDYVRDYVSQADYAVANLETTLAGTENGDEYSGFPKFNCPDAMADALKNAGFDMLLTANNHTYDTGAYGMMRTQEVLADRGLAHLGTRPSEDDPPYQVIPIHGIRVGMICYTYGQIDESTGQKAVNGLPMRQSVSDCINVFDYEKLERFYEEMEGHLADMKTQGAEAFVLFIHWGNEYKLKQNGYQTAIAQKMCDLGVDVIVGGHPHVIEPVELLTSTVDSGHKTLCVYSTGNAISNQRSTNMDMDTGHTEDGMLFSFTFVKYSDGNVYLDSAEILPTWLYVRRSGSAKSYDMLPLDKGISDWKEAFGIGNANLQKAEASYARTQALVGPGMEEVHAYLAQSRSAREQIYQTQENGVG